MTTPKISAKDLSDQLGIDAKALRVYLRANAVQKDDETGRLPVHSSADQEAREGLPRVGLTSRRGACSYSTGRAEEVIVPDDPGPILEQDDARAREALLETHDPADITDEMIEEMQRLQS